VRRSEKEIFKLSNKTNKNFLFKWSTNPKILLLIFLVRRSRSGTLLLSCTSSLGSTCFGYLAQVTVESSIIVIKERIRGQKFIFQNVSLRMIDESWINYLATHFHCSLIILSGWPGLVVSDGEYSGWFFHKIYKYLIFCCIGVFIINYHIWFAWKDDIQSVLTKASFWKVNPEGFIQNFTEKPQTILLFQKYLEKN